MGDPILQASGSPNILTYSSGCKGKDFAGQFQIVYDSFSEYPKTMMQVSVETGVMRTNITRYVSVMLRNGTIRFVKHGVCPITKMGNVKFFQTDQAVNPGSYVSAPVASPILHSIPTPKQSTSALNDLKPKQGFSYSLFNDCTDYE